MCYCQSSKLSGWNINEFGVIVGCCFSGWAGSHQLSILYEFWCAQNAVAGGSWWLAIGGNDAQPSLESQWDWNGNGAPVSEVEVYALEISVSMAGKSIGEYRMKFWCAKRSILIFNEFGRDSQVQ